MKFYIAARYSRIAEVRELAAELSRRGHTITSRWILTDWPITPGYGSSHAPPGYREKHALEDVADVRAADVVVSLTEKPDAKMGGRGGRHVEFGAAVAWGKRLVVIGPQENVFHHLPEVLLYRDVRHYLAHVETVMG